MHRIVLGRLRNIRTAISVATVSSGNHVLRETWHEHWSSSGTRTTHASLKCSSGSFQPHSKKGVGNAGKPPEPNRKTKNGSGHPPKPPGRSRGHLLSDGLRGEG